MVTSDRLRNKLGATSACARSRVRFPVRTRVIPGTFQGTNGRGGGRDGKRGGRACERAGTGRQGGPCIILGLLQAPRLRRRQSAGPFSLTAKRGLRLFAILSASAQPRPWLPSRPNSRGPRSCVETREMFTIRGTIDDIFISSLTLDRPGLSSRLFFPQIHRRSSESSRAFLLAPFLARRTREFG